MWVQNATNLTNVLERVDCTIVKTKNVDSSVQLDVGALTTESPSHCSSFVIYFFDW